jgi:hypothetical protein
MRHGADGLTAAATAWIDPFWGLFAGCLGEMVHGRTLARLRRRAGVRRSS